MTERIVGEGPLVPVVLRLAGPVVAMMYLQGAYNIIDTIWVGRLLGNLALAGIAAGGFVLWGVFGLTNLVAVGTSAMVARRLGEGDRVAAGVATTRGLIYALALSVLVGAFLWALMPAMFQVMGVGEDVARRGSGYLRVILAGCPLIFLSFQILRTFQASGDTVTPLWLMALTLIINTVLDPVFMIGLGGLPAMGLSGAALATVVSRFVFVALGIRLLAGGKRIGKRRWGLPGVFQGAIGLRKEALRQWDWGLLGRMLGIGLPTAVSHVLFPAVYMVLTRLPASFGPEYVAALRIGHTVEGTSFFLALGFSVAAATCIGQNLGAGKPGRAERAGWVSTGVVMAALSAFGLCFFGLSREIAAVFTSDPAVVEAAALYLEILAVSQAFMGLEIVLGGAFAGAGDTVPPMAIFVPLNVLRIPLAYALTGPLGLGVSGVWWAISGSTILKGLMIGAWFLRGRWKERKV